MKNLYKKLIFTILASFSPIFAQAAVSFSRLFAYVTLPLQRERKLDVHYQSFKSEDGRVIFAQVGDVNAGNIVYCYRRPIGLNRKGQPFIETLYVKPEFRGYGIAQHLLHQALGDIRRKFPQNTVEVHLNAYPYGENPLSLDRLIAFYTKHGGATVQRYDTYAKMKFVVQKPLYTARMR